MQFYLVYKLTAVQSKRSYVGVTKNIKHQMAVHRSARILPLDAGYLFQPLACCRTLKAALATERHLIIEHNTLKPFGHNDMLSRELSEQHRAKISKSAIGHQRWLGRTHSAETKVKMSASKKIQAASPNWHKGGPMTEARKLAISLAKKGKPSKFKGIPRPPEVVAKMRAAWALKKKNAH